MESEYTENDRTDEAGTVDEKETVCNQSSSDKVSGRSIVFLKDTDCSAKGMSAFMRLSCLYCFADSKYR